MLQETVNLLRFTLVIKDKIQFELEKVDPWQHKQNSSIDKIIHKLLLLIKKADDQKNVRNLISLQT